MAIQDVFNAVLHFNQDEVRAETQKAMDNGADVAAVLNEGLIRAMDVVGEKFSKGELFVESGLAN